MEDLLAIAGRCRLSNAGGFPRLRERRRFDVAWPVPHRFELFGLQTFGYGEEVAFPLQVTPARRRADRAQGQNPLSRVRAICVPQEASSRSTCRRAPRCPPARRRWSTVSRRWCHKSEERLGWTVERVALDRRTTRGRRQEHRRSFRRARRGRRGRPAFLFRPAQGRALRRSPERAGAVPVERLEGRPDLTESDLTLTIFDGARGMEATARPAAMLAVGAAPNIGA